MIWLLWVNISWCVPYLYIVGKTSMFRNGSKVNDRIG